MPINQMKKNGKIVKDKNGRQGYRVQINYTDMDGKPQQVEKVTYGLAEAKLLEQQLLLDFKEKKETTNARMTVDQLVDDYLEFHRIEIKKTSLDTIARTLRLRVQPYIGNNRIDKLTTPQLSKWMTTIGDQNLADKTKQSAYKTLVALLNYAIKMKYIPDNPLTPLGNFKNSAEVDKQPKKLRYYTKEQFQKYISVARKHCTDGSGWAFYVFFNLAFFTGCRKGELHALKWSDLEGNILHITRTLGQKVKSEDGKDVESTPKTPSSVRDLQLPKPMMKILEEHKERQRAAYPQFTEDFRICGAEKPLRDSSIDTRNRQYAKEAGLPHITIHEFRHSHASLLVNNNISIQEIARRLGHSNVEQTWAVYAHLYPNQEEKCLEILNDVEVD